MISEYKISHKAKKRIKEVKRKARPGETTFRTYYRQSVDKVLMRYSLVYLVVIK